MPVRLMVACDIRVMCSSGGLHAARTALLLGWALLTLPLMLLFVHAQVKAERSDVSIEQMVEHSTKVVKVSWYHATGVWLHNVIFALPQTSMYTSSILCSTRGRGFVLVLADERGLVSLCEVPRPVNYKSAPMRDVAVGVAVCSALAH